MCNKDGLDELLSKESKESQERIHQKSEDILEDIRNNSEDETDSQ
ncbi:hypothetical protein PBI_SCTP2_391 [Salicola phage SCTP-2]|nr:hypothetical protein PBI_SCTP2_391 [Salicola phage SCTP-2]